jgi:hypothetical protein
MGQLLGEEDRSRRLGVPALEPGGDQREDVWQPRRLSRQRESGANARERGLDVNAAEALLGGRQGSRNERSGGGSRRRGLVGCCDRGPPRCGAYGDCPGRRRAVSIEQEQPDAAVRAQNKRL